LKLSIDLAGFEFVEDPGAAYKVLKKQGNTNATEALKMIISRAAEVSEDADLQKLGERDSFDSLVQRNLDSPKLATALRDKTVQDEFDKLNDEAALRTKGSTETVEVVACCCSFW
jgi:hypothetical protein